MEPAGTSAAPHKGLASLPAIREPHLVALHGEFDWLAGLVWERWQRCRIDGEDDGARLARLARDQSGLLERQQHLVDGGRADAEVALYVGLGGGAAMQGR
jgi:hypothetical protein